MLKLILKFCHTYTALTTIDLVTVMVKAKNFISTICRTFGDILKTAAQTTNRESQNLSYKLIIFIYGLHTSTAYQKQFQIYAVTGYYTTSLVQHFNDKL